MLHFIFVILHDSGTKVQHGKYMLLWKILSGTSFSTFYDGIKWIKQRLYYSFYTKDQNRQTIMGNYHSLPAYDPCVMKMGR